MKQDINEDYECPNMKPFPYLAYLGTLEGYSAIEANFEEDIFKLSYEELKAIRSQLYAEYMGWA